MGSTPGGCSRLRLWSCSWAPSFDKRAAVVPEHALEEERDARAREPGADRACEAASSQRRESHRRSHHGVQRLDAIRLSPHHLVCILDRVRSRVLSVRAADDDRLAGGDLPLDLRDDQPEPRGREAPGAGESAVDDRAGRGQAERRVAPALARDPPPDQGCPRIDVSRAERRSGQKAPIACVIAVVAPPIGRRLQSRRSVIIPAMDNAPILICYDGSPDAARGIETAAALLGARRALVLEVASPLTPPASAAAISPGEPGAAFEQENVAEAGRVAARGAELARAAGFDAEARATLGTPTWDAVVVVANELDAAAIVIGSRGLDILHEAFEGSLSHQIAAHAGRPVVIVPPPHDER